MRKATKTLDLFFVQFFTFERCVRTVNKSDEKITRRSYDDLLGQGGGGRQGSTTTLVARTELWECMRKWKFIKGHLSVFEIFLAIFPFDL